jgi:hypothetical protein
VLQQAFCCIDKRLTCLKSVFKVDLHDEQRIVTLLVPTGSAPTPPSQKDRDYPSQQCYELGPPHSRSSHRSGKTRRRPSETPRLRSPGERFDEEADDSDRCCLLSTS